MLDIIKSMYETIHLVMILAGFFLGVRQGESLSILIQYVLE